MPGRHGRSRRTLLAAIVAAFVISLVAGAIPFVPADRASAATAQLRRHPYLTDLVADHVIVNWATDRSATSASVKYGPPGSCTANTVAATRTSITVGSVAEYQWKASISGLGSNTSYCYRVYLGSTDLLGAEASPTFRSQVAAGSSTPFSFAVFGDWGEVDANGANPDQANVMARIAESGVQFALTTGDTGYPGGTQTTYGDLQQTGADTSAIFGPSFWTVAGDSIPLFNATGNHGFNSVGLLNWPQDRAVSSSAGRYQMETYCCTNGTSSASYPSAWYAFDAGPARFYVLEAAWSSVNNGTASQYENDFDNHWTPTSPEYQWLKRDLESHPGGVKFAVWHYPMYSDNSTETSSPYLQGADSLEGLLAANGVDIGFSGHAHVYERNVKPAGGIVTYLTGGGGAKLEPIGAKGCSAFDAYAIGWSYSANRGSACGAAPVPTSRSQVFHFLKVTVNGSTVTVTPTDSTGRTFDVRTYTFDDAAPPPPPPSTLTFAPTDDTYVQQASPTTTAGTSTRIQVDGSPVKEILLKFNVTGLAGRPVTSARLRLYTTDPSSVGGSFYRTVSSSWSEATVNWSTAPAKSGGAITTVGSVATGTWAEADLTPAVTGDGVLSLRVSSTSSNGANYASTEGGSATAPQLVVTYDASGTADTQAPSAPTGLSAQAPSANEVDLHWSASSDNVGVSGYDVYRNGGASPIGSVAGTVTSFSDSSVSASTQYSYTVTARDAAGNASAASNTATVTTPAVAPSVPATPTGLTASAGDGSVSLSWTASAGATGYNLKRATASAGPFVSIASITSTSATDGNVANGTTYYYVVSAVNDAGESANSSLVSATPSAAPAAAVFSDDFETGNLSKWTSSGGLVTQTARVHGGTYAARGSTTNGGTYAKKTLPASHTDAYSRIYFFLASGSTSQVNLLRYRAAGGVSLGYLYVTTTGKLALRNDAGAISKVSGVAVTTDAWHALELRVTINGTAGSSSVWLDGTAVADLSLTGQNWGTSPIAAFQIGEVQTGRTYDVTFDDVVVATQRIGP